MGFKFSDEQIDALRKYEEVFKILPDLFKELENDGIDTEYLKVRFEEHNKILPLLIEEYSHD